jgi:hypothetical protein
LVHVAHDALTCGNRERLGVLRIDGSKALAEFFNELLHLGVK